MLEPRKLRPMRPDDLPEVMVLERRAHAHPWSEGILQDCLAAGYGIKLLEQDGRLLGYGVWAMMVDECQVLNLCIDPDQQRQGHGRYLLRWLLSEARAQGAVMSVLEVRVSNRAAIRLYEAMGYSEIGRRKNYYPKANGREDAIVMAMDLKYFE